jgi:four helix bundle protein
MSLIRTFRELEVYRGAMELTMEIFRLTKAFPAEERYSLTDQVRRSSRSVCANLAEAWRKRRYTAAFISKLNDAEAEAAETQVWIEIACRSGYLSQADSKRLDEAYEKVLGQLVRMVDQPGKWVIGSKQKD